MVAEFASVMLYTQLLVATPAGLSVGLLWTDDAVSQGFAWDKATVAFGVPDHDGECLIQVDTTPDPTSPLVSHDALWAISVPFTATEATVMVGTVMLERPVTIEPGGYRLIFQAHPGTPPYAYRLELSFRRTESPQFGILKQGQLGSGDVLERQARHVD